MSIKAEIAKHICNISKEIGMFKDYGLDVSSLIRERQDLIDLLRQILNGGV